MKKGTSIALLVTGVLCMIGGIGSVAVGIMGLIDDLKPVVVVEAPGSGELQVDAPGVYTLWHDHVTNHGGTYHSYDERLPHGFTFSLTNLDTGTTVPFKPLSSGTQTMNAGQRQSFGLGSFRVPDPGPYKLEASNPARDQRFISMTQGSFISSFGSFGLSFIIAALAGVVGLGLLIVGLIGLIAGRKRQTAGMPPPPPTS